MRISNASIVPVTFAACTLAALGLAQPMSDGLWTIPNGTSGQSTPASTPCGSWMVQALPIETIEHEGCGLPVPSGSPCQGSIFGQAKQCCRPHQERNGAVIDLELDTGVMPCECSDSLPHDDAVGPTLDSVAMDTLMIRGIPESGAAGVKVAVEAVGAIRLRAELEWPVSCNGCAHASIQASLTATSDIPWPWLVARLAAEGSRGASIDANGCTQGGGGATFGIDGTVGLTGPQVGAGVEFPLGPSGAKSIARMTRKLYVYARGCAPTPTTPTDYELRMEARTTASVEVTGGGRSNAHAEAIIEKLAFNFQIAGSVPCLECTPLGGSVGPGLVEPPLP